MRKLGSSITLLAVSAAIVVGAGIFSRYQLRLASADQALLVGDLNLSELYYSNLLDRIPGFISARDNLAQSLTEVAYWRGDYASVVSASVVEGVELESSRYYNLAGSAVYRGMHGETSREAAIEKLDEALNYYIRAMQQDPSNDDAAHNYEYLLRIRNEVAQNGLSEPMNTQQSGNRQGQEADKGDVAEGEGQSSQTGEGQGNVFGNEGRPGENAQVPQVSIWNPAEDNSDQGDRAGKGSLQRKPG